MGWLNACPPPPAAASTLDALVARRAALEAEIAALQRRAAAVPVCQRIAEAPPPPAVVEPRPRPDRPPPDIDRERWEDQDIAMLEGCWNLDSAMSLANVETGDTYPVRVWRMCFDAAGNGEQRLEFEDGTVCTARVRARFETGGTLGLDDLADVPCDGGFRIFRRVSSCRLTAAGHAACNSEQPFDPRGQPSSFTLRR